MTQLLREFVTQTAGRLVVESADSVDDKGNKSLYMKGIFIQGGVKNHNERVYPVQEITRAVNSISEKISEGISVVGELDHPADLKINLDRVSHMITEMWVDGPNGFGKLKVLPTPMGQLVRAMLESGVKLGVSSRGSGNVEADGRVSGFEIVTVDIVATPSAPNAYPAAIYESLMNYKGGNKMFDLARDSLSDPRAQKYLRDAVTGLIKDLKIK
jgi:hypothetical protein